MRMVYLKEIGFFFFFIFGIEDWNGNGFEKEVIQFLKFRSNQLLVFCVLL